MASVPEVRSARLDLTLRNKSGMSIEYLLAIDPKPTQEEMIATKDQFVKHLQKVAESDAWSLTSPIRTQKEGRLASGTTQKCRRGRQRARKSGGD